MRHNRLVIFLLTALCFAMISVSGCARIKIQTDATRECKVEPFDKQSEVKHELKVVSLRGDFDASGEIRTADDKFTGLHAKNLMSRATKVAREGQANDFACKIKLTLHPELQLNGPVPEIEPLPGASECVRKGDICTEDDFNYVIDMQPAGIKLVNRIGWCGVKLELGAFYGCSKRGGHSIIVESTCKGEHCPQSEGVLWLHELGHTMGMQDRPNSDRRPAVMRSSIEAQNKRLTKCDCLSFRKNRQ